MTKNFKKTMAILLAVLMMVSVLPMTVFGESEGYYIYSVSNGEAEIIDVGTSISGDITIPSTLGGHPVTSIVDDAFSYCTGLTSITIPNGVTSIGDWAFSFCTGLTSITIPNSVTSIGHGAFYYCTGLTSITIPNSVKSIGEEAFYGCTGLTSITIPNSVTSIGVAAFADCTGLTSITIPNSVTSIGDGAFSGCTDLTIKGSNMSYARIYARTHFIPFQYDSDVCKYCGEVHEGFCGRFVAFFHKIFYFFKNLF